MSAEKPTDAPAPTEFSLIVGNAIVTQQGSSKEEAIDFVNRFHRDRKLCPRCGVRDQIADWSETDGCRLNGDAYGKLRYECKACKWSTYTVWDEY